MYLCEDCDNDCAGHSIAFNAKKSVCMFLKVAVTNSVIMQMDACVVIILTL